MMDFLTRMGTRFRGASMIALAAVLGVFGFVATAGVAGAAPLQEGGGADPVETSISTLQGTLTGYAPLVIGALVACLLAFAGIKILPRIWNAILNRFSG